MALTYTYLYAYMALLDMLSGSKTCEAAYLIDISGRKIMKP
jgi:hypothetical protein